MRRKTKRAVLTIAATLLLGILFSVIFFTYQEQTSYRTLISKDAQIVVRVDIYEILRSTWREFRELERENKRQPSGIRLAANVFAWTSARAGNSALYISLPLKDSNAFVSWLKAKGFESGAGNVLRHKQAYISAINNRHTAIICVDIARRDHASVLADMLAGNNMVPVAESAFAGLKEQQGHISFRSKDLKGELNFEEGKIQAYVLTNYRKEYFAETTAPARLSEGEAVKVFYNGDINALIRKQFYQVDSFSISGDSLRSSGIKGFQFCLSRPVLQKDSVTTYEYDDNFEKIAIATVNERNVPGIGFSISASTGLYTYLKRIKVIDDDNFLADAVFPLTPLKAGYAEGALHLTNVAGYQVPQERGANFLEVAIDFGELSKQPDIRPFNNLWKPFTTFYMAGKVKDGIPVCDAQLNFKQPGRNALLQILAAL